MNSKELDQNLARFYVEARTKKGEEYSRSALLGFRNSIERHLNNNGVTVKISKNQVFQNSNKILDAKLRINRRAGKENIQHKPVIVPSDLAKIRASPFHSLVLHSCKVRTEWPPTFRCRPQPKAFRVAFLTPVIFRATSRCFSAYRAALMTKILIQLSKRLSLPGQGTLDSNLTVAQ
ncbi:unnamed protein product [Pocillopora meandrina]|uniref:Uncharacterized protein n=1 Tax=Pocillopora meandrina TaxID=46732 RepID=A0AAU9WED5_9CNID|nr:unnamed protein product [Pocillopora meandrina]